MASTDSPLLEVAASIGALNIKFIVDTGSSVSIIPSSFIKGALIQPTNISLSSANGQEIKCKGQTKLEIKIPNLRRTFKRIFIIAETVKPLLGIDFLNNFQLMVDCAAKKITDPMTKQSVNMTTSRRVGNILVNDVKLPRSVEEILKTYPELTSPHTRQDRKNSKVFHRIHTLSHPPVYASQPKTTVSRKTENCHSRIQEPP
ncbi:uncharacterized protein LOC108676116 [Hyalella azteca]|uniref:Uncharacterized protein LOC108676116 n=1 Tax=Hyalella azteca TaxID=294128 RepID=A0A8B7P106_HYAAZ|nr:uncharacterized protein LOC108676116 [Hyalella azteca]